MMNLELTSLNGIADVFHLAPFTKRFQKCYLLLKNIFKRKILMFR